MRGLLKLCWAASGIILGSTLFVSQGACEESVLIGINVPLTGAYALQGEDQLKAYKLAIQQVNENGGILGKKVTYTVMDSQTKANIARDNAKRLIADGAVMITGGCSSAVAIAQSEECQKAGVVFMAGLTHSNATTGKNAHRHTFRWYNNGYQSAKAMGTLLADRFGKEAKYAFLYADYTWGKTVEQSMKAVIEKSGAHVVLERPTMLGKKSFLYDLLAAKDSGANVLVLVHFGDDMVHALRQANKFRDKMAIVVPLMEINMANYVGPFIMHGVITSMTWYHGLSEKYEGSRVFVEAFEKAYRKKPGNAAAVAWVDIFQYADAVNRAGSFDHVKVIKALEGHQFTLLGDKEYWRDWDHQGVHPTYVAIGKNPEQCKDQWDLFDIISTHRGEDVVRTKKENPVQLEPLH